MTSEQRRDLAIEWQITSTKIKQNIKAEYHREYGHDQQTINHWENYLVSALNIKHYWQTVGLSH